MVFITKNKIMELKLSKDFLPFNNENLKCLFVSHKDKNSQISIVKDINTKIAECSSDIDLQLEKNEVFIKESSTLEFLLKHDILHTPKKCVFIENQLYPICKINELKFDIVM